MTLWLLLLTLFSLSTVPIIEADGCQPPSGASPLLNLMRWIVDDAEVETARTYGLVYQFVIEDPSTSIHIIGELRRSHPRTIYSQWHYTAVPGTLDVFKTKDAFRDAVRFTSPSTTQTRLLNDLTLTWGCQPSAAVKGRVEGDW